MTHYGLPPKSYFRGEGKGRSIYEDGRDVRAVKASKARAAKQRRRQMQLLYPILDAYSGIEVGVYW